MNIQIFFGKAVSQNSSKPLIVKGFYILRMSDDYCYCRAAKGKLSQRNRRNTATVLRAVVKSHNCLKETKVFACGCSGRNLKRFSKFAGKSSSVKWSDPGHFLKAQGKFIFSFPYTLFLHIFDT